MKNKSILDILKTLENGTGNIEALNKLGIDIKKDLKEFNEKINSEEWKEREHEIYLKWLQEQKEIEEYFLENGVLPNRNKIPKKDYIMPFLYSGIYSKNNKAVAKIIKA